jgi:hypothetical protein
MVLEGGTALALVLGLSGNAPAAAHGSHGSHHHNHGHHNHGHHNHGHHNHGHHNHGHHNHGHHNHGYHSNHHGGYWHYRNGHWAWYETIYVVYYRPTADLPWTSAGNFYSLASAEDEAVYFRSQGYESFVQ